LWKARWIFTVCSGCRILEQNKNNAKGRTGPIVITLRNHGLAQVTRDFAEIHRRAMVREAWHGKIHPAAVFVCCAD
jgi:hypothetical protein